MQGISTTVVLVRVELGVSYDHSTATTTSLYSRRPIEILKPSQSLVAVDELSHCVEEAQLPKM